MIANALSVDVEECFHASELRVPPDPKRWRALPSRVEAQTARVLELLARHDVHATFFVLGWIAETRPELVCRIAAAGHEIACHSYAHRLVYEMTPGEFRDDTLRATEAIVTACGVRPQAYRAPSYSITNQSLWALDTLVECGYRYDSSIYPIHHDRYGIPGFSRGAAMLQTAAGPICEVPVAAVHLGGHKVAPVGGGAYLRLLPYRYTAAGIRRINREEERPACVYFHPWELDAEQARMAPGMVSRLRTYGGVSGMEAKLERLLDEFRFTTLRDAYPYPAAGVMKAGG